MTFYHLWSGSNLFCTLNLLECRGNITMFLVFLLFEYNFFRSLDQWFCLLAFLTLFNFDCDIGIMQFIKLESFYILFHLFLGVIRLRIYYNNISN